MDHLCPRWTQTRFWEDPDPAQEALVVYDGNELWRRFIATLGGAAHWKQLKRRNRCRFGKMTRKVGRRGRNLIWILSLLRERGQADMAQNQRWSRHLRDADGGSLPNGPATRGSWGTGRYRSLVAGEERRHQKVAALAGGGA